MADSNNNAKSLIERSVSHNEIVTVEYDADVASDLLVRCDDNVEVNGITEFWGTDDEGNEWRVHLRGVAVTDEAAAQ